MTSLPEPDGGRSSPSAAERYALTLFVSGTSALSGRAIEDVSRFCELHLVGLQYELTVIDVHQDAEAVAASALPVLATPSLFKTFPPPARQCVGDLSRFPAMLATLGLPTSSVVT